MEAHGERTGVVYCWANMIDSCGVFLTHCAATDAEGDVLPVLIKSNFMVCGSVPLFRTAALASVGLYLTRTEQNGAQGCEDWDLLMRMAERYEVHVARSYLVGYRQTDGMSLVTQGMVDSFDLVRQRAQQRNAHPNQPICPLTAAPFYYWLGRRCYIAGKFWSCITLMIRTLIADRSYFRDETVYLLLVKSSMRLVVGRISRKASVPGRQSPGSVASMFPPFNPSGVRIPD
jgi:hypothetical protein